MSSKQSSHSWSLLTDYHGLPLHRYRYQLESFVDKVKGRQPRTWLDGEDSVANMEWIERIYEKVSPSSPSARRCYNTSVCNRLVLGVDLNRRLFLKINPHEPNIVPLAVFLDNHSVYVDQGVSTRTCMQRYLML